MVFAGHARRHLATIARAPRPAGGKAEDAAREHCASVLRACGFAVADRPVEYSALPGRYATPVIGAAMGAAIADAAVTAASGSGAVALAVLIAAVLAAAIAGRWLARVGVLTLPLMRAATRNLVAARGRPRVWLVAHLDSKSQPVPIGLRAAGLIALGLTWIAGVILAIGDLAGLRVAPYGVYVAVAAGFAALPVVASVVGSRSDGARDNASGVAAVLCAIEQMPRDAGVGVVLTSAEELGLAGARAWAREREHTPRIAINVDTIDDAGDVSVMYSGRLPAVPVTALRVAAVRRDSRIVVRRLVPGILTDAVALSAAGWDAVTVSKATLMTLARVHTAADTAETMSATGIAEVAGLLADAVQAISTDED